MNELHIFKNNEFGAVRALSIDGEPWFVGKDVAEILGYTNPQKAIRDHVDEDDKGVNEMDTPGGTQRIVFINESGLYSLVLQSKLPSAKKFKHWVASDVLPTIRKHGVYAVDEVLQNPDMLIEALQALKVERAEREKLAEENAIHIQQIAELQPKATYYDMVLQSPDAVLTTVIAKDYGMSARTLNKILRDCHIQYKLGDSWILYQKYAEKGYTTSKTYALDDGRTAMNTCWTQKGRLFIYDLLKSNGILPTIERE